MNTLFPTPPPTQRPTQTLEGTVVRVTFQSEDGYTVARLEVERQRDLITIVGHMATVQPGERIRAKGYWGTHAKHGDQFTLLSYESLAPATLTGVQAYLGGGLIKGIGKIFAGKLVEKFGMETLDVIESTPARLLEIHGIGKKRVAAITKAWEEQKEVRAIMVFLSGHGISPAFATRIFKAYGQGAVNVVTENPYRLALDIRGCGFKTADRVAKSLGIGEDSPLRAAAGAFHMLQQLTDEGHVYVPLPTLLARTEQDLNIPPALLPATIPELVATGKVILEELPSGAAVYLKPLHVAEEALARRITHLLRAPSRLPRIDTAKAIAWVEERIHLELSEEQRRAIAMAVQGKLAIITGGPGTGKTTILQALIKILEAKGARIHLAAPTGRAAKRMSEVIGRPAQTLHRLLEWKDGRFLRTREHPLETDVVVVDETSMLDVALAFHLVQAVPLPATLILVGDADQLPSVGPGTVLRDLLEFDGIPHSRLHAIFRQAQKSRIVISAHRINDGVMPLLTDPGPDETPDCFFREEEDVDKTRDLIVNLVTDRLPKKSKYNPFEDIQVLTPMHRGKLGAKALNEAIQAALNPPAPDKPEAQHGPRIFRVGDRVMQVKNNYDRGTRGGVFNGDLGRVVAVDPVEKTLAVQIDDEVIGYDWTDMDELTLAYATTIHRAQGSQYPCCVLCISTQAWVMLQRNLLYTGLTRAQKLLILVGTTKAIAIAVKNDKITQRFSRLTERLVAYRSAPPPAEPETNSTAPEPIFQLLNEGLSDELTDGT